MIDYVKIVYDKEPCKKCGGQIMTVFIKKETVDRRCIKCDNFRIRLRPECNEERLGRVMHIYYLTGCVVDKYW